MRPPDLRHFSLVDLSGDAESRRAPAGRSRRSRREKHPAASKLARWLAEYRSWEEAQGAERSEKLIEVKLRLSRGYYDRPEVQEKILRALLRDLLPPHAASASKRKPPARGAAASSPRSTAPKNPPKNHSRNNSKNPPKNR